MVIVIEGVLRKEGRPDRGHRGRMSWKSDLVELPTWPLGGLDVDQRANKDLEEMSTNARTRS